MIHTIRLLVADDHPVVRAGLKRLLGEHPDMLVVAEATDAEEVLNALDKISIDVVLLDVSMPGPGFLETLKEIKSRHPRGSVLVLSIYPEEQYALRAIKAGASGYLTKNSSPEELVEAIRRCAHGGRYVTHALADKLVRALGGDWKQPDHTSLSDREFQILRLSASGKSVKEMAAQLSLSPKTVSTYRTRIREKLNLSSNAETIRYAIEHKLID